MAGRKISRANMQRIQEIANHAYAMGAKGPDPDRSPLGSKADTSLGDQIQAVAMAVHGGGMDMSTPYVEEVFAEYVILCSGETYYKAAYSTAEDGAVTLAARDAWVEVEEVWQEKQVGAKAGLPLDIDASDATPYASLKAVGDRLIEVKVAYGGHRNGKDSHGEYFSPNTDFDPENFPAPPLLYYHGFDTNGKKMGKPAVTGKFTSRRVGSNGHYLTYKLKNTKHADMQWSAAQKGACVVSPGTIGHLIRKNPDGELLYWPLAEISAWDYAPNRAPANLHSVAAPVIKALYLSEGLTPPPVISTAASETPEAGGDPASVQAQAGGASLEEAARIIAAEAAAALLPLRKGT